MHPHFRGQLMTMYRGHIDHVLGKTLPTMSSAAELIAAVKTIPVPDFEAGNGWETRPPFPGSSEYPEEMPTGWRMICASRLYDRDDQEICVLFATFVSGHRATVVATTPGTVIPEEYLPVAAR